MGVEKALRHHKINNNGIDCYLDPVPNRTGSATMPMSTTKLTGREILTTYACCLVLAGLLTRKAR
jgi:hypothetical protein